MGLQKDGVRAVLETLAHWPHGLQVGLFTVVPSWDADREDGTPGQELDVAGYSRQPFELSVGSDHGDAIVMKSVPTVDFGPFTPDGSGGVTVEGWGIWSPKNHDGEPGDYLMAAGLFYGEESAELVTVPDGMQLRIASGELMIGIGPVEWLA